MTIEAYKNILVKAIKINFIVLRKSNQTPWLITQPRYELNNKYICLLFLAHLGREGKPKLKKDVCGKNLRVKLELPSCEWGNKRASLHGTMFQKLTMGNLHFHCSLSLSFFQFNLLVSSSFNKQNQKYNKMSCSTSMKNGKTHIWNIYLYLIIYIDIKICSNPSSKCFDI